jgi:methylmalonyl-CoA mutase
MVANERAQMLKYHIQTSGRSYAQEIDFNDIRFTSLVRDL